MVGGTGKIIDPKEGRGVLQEERGGAETLKSEWASVLVKRNRGSREEGKRGDGQST